MKSLIVPIAGILISVLVALLIALAGGSGGALVEGIPVFALCGLLAFVIQWLMFLPAFALQTERFYDITGSITYVLVTGLALAASPHSDGPRLLITVCIVLWATRLGSFLLSRILADKEDTRFRHIKPRFFMFLMTWTLQGLWVLVTAGAGLAAITSPAPAAVTVWTVVGAGIWVLGFVFEVVADRQKRQFRADPANRDRFIQHGLWGYSRHPNYFGEIVLWTGIAVIAFPLLSGWQYLTLISPLFVWLLLTRISGINLLEAQGRKRWGDDEAYRAYCRGTPVLVPKLRIR